MNSFFYSQVEKNDTNELLIDAVEKYVNETKEQVYIINKPLGEKKYTYDYEDKALVLLSPKHKIIFLDIGIDEELFEEYIDDFIEDLGSISDKFSYRDYIGRPKKWKREVVEDTTFTESFNVKELLENNKINDVALQRKSELLISLLTGSINDIETIKCDVPETLLDKVKRKIVLFDGDQTRFIYQKPRKHRINIQGLSGTGKTELLLHKLKEIYTESKDSKIMFTCFNKILASSLRKRIPDFFNFMKMDEQIKWNTKLWTVNAWGSKADINSGAYRYICDFYNVNFYRFSFTMNFDKACKLALEEINQIDTGFEYAFDYMLIDESQDFPESFFELCDKVTKNNIYVAGDIFQDIFDNNIENSTNADFLLSRCYRTDPRTLMFAHSLGMGLFETPKLNWLSDEEWKACGYIVENDGNNVNLSRESLRRFEDLDLENIESMKILAREDNSVQSIEKSILKIIKNIRKENNTVLAEDIAIIFVDGGKYVYNLADRLEFSIMEKFEWGVNKAYESKEKISDNIFISNKNNVKGLEFPFVICIANTIKSDLKYRNALYMMLTRSFIQSYLLVADSDTVIPDIQNGLNKINTKNYIETTTPTKSEQENIKNTIIQYKEENSISYKDFLTMIFNDLKIDSKCRKTLEKMISDVLENTFDQDLVVDFIETNKKFCK